MVTKRVVKEIVSLNQSVASTRPVRVCAYVRVSTSHEGQLNSLQNQTDYYTSKFASSPHLSFRGVFSDAGVSGAKLNRPGFLAMLNLARAGEIDLIYTKSISRFARNTLMLLEIVRELRDLGVGILFEEQNINTLKSDGELMLTVLASIAEEERKSVCSNVQWALRKKCLRGEVMVDTNRLLGFTKDESGKLVIHPEEAAIVCQIFRMYLDGLSGYRIAQILTKQNVPTYGPGLWQSQRILSIIGNEKYAGACRMQKTFIDETGRQVPNRGERDQYYMEDSHPAIISPSDWETAQVIRSKRAPKSYPFTRLLRCAYCGASLTRVTSSGSYIRWVCHRYLSKGKASCIGSRITEARLLELTKDCPITEPVIVEEVYCESYRTARSKKSYRLVRVSETPKEK